jgi:signal transduction histidine kinase
MKIRLGISLVVAIMAVAGLLYLQYVWVQKLYLAEQKRIQTVAFSELDIALGGELIMSSLEWQKRYFNKGINPPRNLVSFDYEEHSIKVIQEGLPTIEKKFESKDEFFRTQRWSLARYHFSGMNLSRLDSVYAKHLAKYDIKLPYVIEKIDCATQKPIGATVSREVSKNYGLVTDSLPLGIDGKAALVVRFDNSYSAMFRHMQRFLVSSIEIVVILILILYFLIYTIFYQKRVSEQLKNMSHEMRNPIAFLQRVLDSLPDAQRRSRLVKVGEFKITLANLMLDKLLTIKKARIDIHPEEFSVRQLLDNVMMQYELMLEPTGKIKLEYETTQELITADKLCFLNAIVNLVDNAIKYSSGAPDIFVRCFTAGDYLCVSVTDHGVGIPKKYLKRIFRREFRIPKGKTVRCTGFGIGLSYIKMIAKAHKGKITVSSIYKKGTTFTLSIPKNR